MAIFYPGINSADLSVLINDSLEDRKDEHIIMAYLRSKYNLEHLQTMPMQQYSGMILTKETFDDVEPV